MISSVHYHAYCKILITQAAYIHACLIKLSNVDKPRIISQMFLFQLTAYVTDWLKVPGLSVLMESSTVPPSGRAMGRGPPDYL